MDSGDRGASLGDPDRARVVHSGGPPSCDAGRRASVARGCSARLYREQVRTGTDAAERRVIAPDMRRRHVGDGEGKSTRGLAPYCSDSTSAIEGEDGLKGEGDSRGWNG